MPEAPDETLPYTPTLETKPGPKTTEFWVTMFTNGLGVFELVFGGLNVQNEYVVIALGVINGLYAASRGLAKQGIPAEDPNVVPVD